jgi:peptide/nickel transport system permease protein
MTGGRVRNVGRRLLRLLGEMAIVAVLVVVFTNLLIRLAPGDPARVILGTKASPEQIAALRDQLGLDTPLPQQVVGMLVDLSRGDLGATLADPDRSVMSLIVDALPVTLTLIVLTVVISGVVGILLGLWGALSRRRAVDQGVSAGAIALLALPPFVLSLLLLLLVAVAWGLAPAGGWGDGWPGNLAYAWLPALALCGLLMPQVIRTVRQNAGELRSQEFVESAHSLGLSPIRVNLRHILPNASLPVITVLGLNAAALIAGAVVVESVFGIPGLGQVLEDAVASRDYPVIQGVALVTALIVVLINAATDLIYGLVDPRVRVQT